MDTTHYDVLEVPRDADLGDVRAAYKRLAKATHPDVGGSTALFRAVNAAWETLKDPAARAAYDRSLSGAAPADTQAAHQPRQPRSRSNEPRRSTAPRRTSGPAVIGTPGAAASHGRAGQVGLVGERRVAGLLRSCAALPSGAFVVHDLQVTADGANIDHVVVHGRSLLIIDTKTWADGTYRTTRRGKVWRTLRDGTRERFEHGEGVGPAVTFLAGVLTEHLGVSGWRATRLLVVSSPSGEDTHLDLGRFRADGLEVVRACDLDARVAAWASQVERTDGAAAAGAASPRLVGMVGSLARVSDVRDSPTPLPSGPLAGPLPALTGHDTARFRRAGATAAAVAALTCLGLVANVPLGLVAALLWGAVEVSLWHREQVGLLTVDIATFVGQSPVDERTWPRKVRAAAVASMVALGVLRLLMGEGSALILAGMVGPLLESAAPLLGTVGAVAAAVTGWRGPLPDAGPDRTGRFLTLVGTPTAAEAVNVLRWHAAHSSPDAARLLTALGHAGQGWDAVAKAATPRPKPWWLAVPWRRNHAAR